MKACIVSDSHDRAAALDAAVAIAKAEGAEVVIHCGDVIGANTLRPLVRHGLPVHVVHGNNLGDPGAFARIGAATGGLVHYHGADAELALAGRRVVATHYPHYGRGLACTGDWDVVCCGHSHEAGVVRQPNLEGSHTWIVNPGTVAGLGAPATWIFADFDTLNFEIRALPATHASAD